MDDSTNKCIKCDKTFSNKSSLNRHQKGSKSCGTNSYDCSHCAQNFSTKQRLDYHLLNSCEEKKESEKQTYKDIIKIKDEELKIKDEIISAKDKKLKDQDDYYDELIRNETISKERAKNELRIYKETSEIQIAELKKTIEELHEKMLKLAATKSVSNVNNVNSNNNITLNMFITPEFAKSQASKYLTYNHFANGFKGIANFVHDFVLVDNSGKLVYACYDKARHILRYKDDGGNEIDDIDAEKLIAIVGPPIKDKYTKICKELREDIERFQKIIEDDDESHSAKTEARQSREKTEFSLRVMEMQSGDVCMIGTSKDKRLSRAIEKSCLAPKI